MDDIERPIRTLVKFDTHIEIYCGIAQFSLRQHGFLVRLRIACSQPNDASRIDIKSQWTASTLQAACRPTSNPSRQLNTLLNVNNTRLHPFGKQDNRSVSGKTIDASREWMTRYVMMTKIWVADGHRGDIVIVDEVKWSAIIAPSYVTSVSITSVHPVVTQTDWLTDWLKARQ